MPFLDRLRSLFAAPAPVEAPAPPPPAPRPAPAPKPRPDTPAGRRTIELRGQDITALDGPVTADISIDLANCRQLRTLPDGIRTGSLNLSGCTALERLPAGLDVAFLDLDGCTELRALPADLRLRGGRLNLRGCRQLAALPDGLGEVAQLNLAGCAGIRELPDGLIVTSWIDVADSGITALPELYDPVGLRWNGLPVSRRIAFAPETITAAEIQAERDPKLRQLMAARAGCGG